jgi:hypothetical protein
MMPRGPVTFLGMQERIDAPPIALFNSANGFTLTEEGLLKHGLRVPTARISADLLALALRHCRAAEAAKAAGDHALAERETSRAHAIAEARWS